jgi:4-diphosphocytidyl-2-C-methyl-D-erythritol kinase
MAGGSADAAAALRLAMAVAPGRAEEVDAIAASLGADVPSQLLPGVAVGTGAGELVERFGPLAPHAYVILPAAHALPTADVYREADRLGLGRSEHELAARYDELLGALAPGAALAGELIVNDLQRAALSLCPSIRDALTAVRAAGAEQALVCGSGPTVAGIWWGPEAAGHAETAAALLRGRWPGTLAATPITAEFAMPSMV